MNPLPTLIIALAATVAIVWLVLALYGWLRGDPKTKPQDSRKKPTDSGGGGCGTGGGCGSGGD